MSILKVARIGHPVVRTLARELSPEDIRTAEVQRLIDDMMETMHEYDGVGVAAPQVHVSLRLAVLETPESDERAEVAVPASVLINPVVTPLGEEKQGLWEGCLSVPGLRGVVPRFTRVRLAALDREGRPWEVEARGFFARVIQHECDHLDGRVYLDRMTNMRTLAFNREFDRLVAEHEAKEQEKERQEDG
jgi:peptide deformylase